MYRIVQQRTQTLGSRIDLRLTPRCHPSTARRMTSSFALPAAAAEGFKDAKSYDTYRPSYHEEAVEALLRKLKIADKPALNVIEIGSGTGKFTELLAARHENYNIVAVEPHDGMRDQLIAKGLRDVNALKGQYVILEPRDRSLFPRCMLTLGIWNSAANIPVEDQWGDACIAAQSFHW